MKKEDRSIGGVSEQRLYDVVEVIYDDSRREHRRTRAWMVLLTAPSWGALVGAAMGVPEVATFLATVAGVGYAVAVKFGVLFH